MSQQVLGIDGARGGWVAAEHDLRANTVSLAFYETLGPLVARLATTVAVIAIDMPIGLSTDGNRPVDTIARQRLGPRRSTFFPTPIRSVLDRDEYADANAHSKATCGLGLSKQAWNLVPKIRELDAVWKPELANRLVEAHPETSFAEMASGPVMTKKATAEGRVERLDLLQRHLDSSVEDAVAALPARWAGDAIDALALVWTAARVLEGRAVVLGGELDAANRPMQLVI